MQDIISQLVRAETFASPWFWLLYVLYWHWQINWALGIPVSLALESRDAQGHSRRLFESRLQAARQQSALYFTTSGTWVILIWSFLLSSCASLAFIYGIEFAQGLLALLLPFLLCQLLSLRLVKRLNTEHITGAELVTVYLKHRRIKLIIATTLLIITSFWAAWLALISRAI